MKRVRIALAAVAIFAVIGGALALKSRTQQKVFLHDPNDTVANRCTVTAIQRTLAVSDVFVTKTLATAISTQPCTLVNVYEGE